LKAYTFSRHFCSSAVLSLVTAVLLVLAGSTLAFCGPIHDAARKGDLKKIQELVKGDPTLVSSKDKLGNTPLHLAVFNDHKDVAEFLIASGADVNAKNNYPSFMPGDLNDEFATNNHKDPLDLLTAKGIDAKAATNGYTPLDLALFSFKHKDVVDLLIAKGADVNARAASGATPLFWAVMRDLRDDAKLLLSKGADVNGKDAWDDSLLHCALRMGFLNMAQILIDAGADVNAKDQAGFTPLYYAVTGDNNKIAAVLRQHGAK
jgi:ankyrin repeat protein